MKVVKMQHFGEGLSVSLLLTVMFPLVSPADSITWRFNGSDGVEAPESIADDTGVYVLTRRQFGTSGTFAKQMTQTASAGNVLYWYANGVTNTSSRTSGSVQMYRWALEDSVPSVRHSAGYFLADSSKAKSLFPTNSAGNILSFTLEMFFKVPPYVPSSSSTMYSPAKNFYLAWLSRQGYEYNTVFKLNGLSAGSIHVQAESHNYGNGDVLSANCVPESAFRDGQWHHIALAYSLDEEAVPQKGVVRVYLDYALMKSAEISSSSGIKTFRYTESDTDVEKAVEFNIGEIKDRGPDLCIDEVRLTNRALGPEDFMHAVWDESLKEKASGTIARWTFDAPGSSGEEVGTNSNSVVSYDGQSFWGLRGATFVGSVTGDWGTSWDPDGDSQPVFTNEVPHRIVWDPGAGVVVNADNATSIFFKHKSENGASSQTNMGSSVYSQKMAFAGRELLPSNFTFECFMKCDKTFEGNVSGLFGLFKPGNRSDKYAVLDVDRGKKPRVCFRIVGDSYKTLNSNYVVNDGSWHHVAANVDFSSRTSVVVKLWVDYTHAWESETQGSNDFNPASLGVTFGAMMQDKAFSGLIDEPRISSGAIGTNRFLRAFVQRADMTGVWLIPTNSLLTGAEWRSPETEWLVGRWQNDALMISESLPATETVMPLDGKTIRASSSVAFNGSGGFSIPCAAIVGTNVFTVEANVCGSGGIFNKRRYGNVASWEVGTSASGVFVGVDGARAASAVNVDDGKWHHVALVVDCVDDMTATLYVDGSEAATVDVSTMQTDAGDLVVGEDFMGNILGVRFSPGRVDPGNFMMAGAPKGLMIFFK